MLNLEIVNPKRLQAEYKWTDMDAESEVREALKIEFGTDFLQRKLQVGLALDAKPALKKFDAVSADGKIIAMVKNYTAENQNGNQTRHARVMRDLYFLCLFPAERKFMYLSESFYHWLSKQRDAAIAPGIEVRVILGRVTSVLTLPSAQGPIRSRGANMHHLNFYPLESMRHVGQAYDYWWDITQRKRLKIVEGGGVSFRKKDTRERSEVEVGQLLPLLTEERRTSRRGHPWGVKALPGRPNELAIEPGPEGHGGWAYFPVAWV